MAIHVALPTSNYDRAGVPRLAVGADVPRAARLQEHPLPAFARGETPRWCTCEPVAG